MKPDYSKYFLFVFATVLICGCELYKSEAENPRQKILFDFDWKFYRGDAQNAQMTDFEDSAWRTPMLMRLA